MPRAVGVEGSILTHLLVISYAMFFSLHHSRYGGWLCRLPQVAAYLPTLRQQRLGSKHPTNASWPRISLPTTHFIASQK